MAQSGQGHQKDFDDLGLLTRAVATAPSKKAPCFLKLQYETI